MKKQLIALFFALFPLVAGAAGGSGYPLDHIDLDLADILFIDSSGVALLRQLTTRQVALTNCSPFTAQQLRS